MKSTLHFLAAGIIVASLATLAETVPPPADAAGPRIEHGKYLVHQAGLCIDCHSPRDEKGGFIESRHLQGAPIGFKPTLEMPWMPVAPRIAGLPAGYSSGDMVRFLTTGLRPNGSHALPPMPPYRFNREDAEAITAYLRDMGTAAR